MKDNKKTSANRKLIPAVAMLTTSAVMLSTATYAWFTLNKEVEVTGLAMHATAGDSLEISLGAISNSGYTNESPGKDDASWRRAIDVDDYYALVGKLKPVSSDKGTSLFKVTESSVYAGGRNVEADSAVTKAKGKDAAAFVLDMNVNNQTIADDKVIEFHVSENTDNEGYYIDVPMWIRTNAQDDSVPIDCTVTITDPNSNNGSVLINAVRVAILPRGVADTSEGIKSINNFANDGVIELGNNLSGSIFGLTSDTYYDRVLNSEGKYGDDVADNKVTVYQAASSLIDSSVLDTDDDKDNANVTPVYTVFNLNKPSVDDYSVCAFIARIWIEGESIYCNDATANQDWRIDFHFNIHEGEGTATSEIDP